MLSIELRSGLNVYKRYKMERRKIPPRATSRNYPPIDTEALPRVTIPRIIMQTWKNDNVPLNWKPSPESIKRLMPDWEYVLMTDDDNREFIKQHFPDFLPYYDKFEYPIQRADAIRYCFLAVHGGVYMDLDIELQKPLDDLFTSDSEVYLVASGNMSSHITNSFMASKPGAQLWYEVIEEMKKPLPWWAIGKHWKVMNSTGPLMLNRVVKRGKWVYAALPTSSIMPCSVCDEVCDRPDAYVRPLPGQSWCSIDSLIYNFFLCRWRFILLVVVVLIILLIVYLMYFRRRRRRRSN